jgi:hypothetical protein
VVLWACDVRRASENGGRLQRRAGEAAASTRGVAKHTHHLPWKVFSFIWIYDDFILLPLGKVVLNRFVWVSTSGMTPEVLAAFRISAGSNCTVVGHPQRSRFLTDMEVR